MERIAKLFARCSDSDVLVALEELLPYIMSVMTKCISDSDETDNSQSDTDAGYGETPLESRDGSLTPVRFRIPLHLKRRLDAFAAAHGLTYSDIVRQALLAWFSGDDDTPESGTPTNREQPERTAESGDDECSDPLRGAGH